MASRPLFQDLDKLEKSYDGRIALRLEAASLKRDSQYNNHENMRTTSTTSSRTICVRKSPTHQDCADDGKIMWETHAEIQTLAGQIREQETRYSRLTGEMEQLRAYLTEMLASVKAENHILTEAVARAGRTKEVMRQEIENLQAQYDTLQETSFGFERGQAVLQQESDALKDEMRKLRKRKRPWWRRSRACKLQSRH